MAKSDRCCNRLVERPTDSDLVLNLRQATVDHFRTWGSRVTISTVDAGTDTTDRKSDIALKDLGLARFLLTQNLYFILFIDLVSCWIFCNGWSIFLHPR